MAALQQHLAALLEWARSGYGHVLLQVGSVLDDTRNLVTATQADAVLLLAREHRTTLSALQESSDVLRENGARSVAALLVKARP
jgi:Mrp family chromosome partitioning ATPase